MLVNSSMNTEVEDQISISMQWLEFSESNCQIFYLDHPRLGGRLRFIRVIPALLYFVTYLVLYFNIYFPILCTIFNILPHTVHYIQYIPHTLYCIFDLYVLIIILGSASRLFGGIPAGSGNFNGDVARIPDLSGRAANIQRYITFARFVAT